MYEAIATLSMINIDSGDPTASAAFYAKALGWEIAYSGQDYGMITSESGATIGFGRIANYTPPAWPDDDGTKRFHLDLQINDLDAAKSELIALGTSVAEFQPDEEKWTVMLDPQGQPFCLVATAEDSPTSA